MINEELGIVYGRKGTSFKVWAPERERMDLLLYSHPLEVSRREFSMEKDENGIHRLTIYEDLKGWYYTYLVEGKYEITDPYSIALSLNSTKSAIVDLKETNPKGWENHPIPQERPWCNRVIYELHIKDFTFHPSAGVKHRGKYLGLAQRDTRFKNVSTGIDHLKELGITHVQLMPVFDFLTVNEDEKAFFKDNNYNWGYDPEHYNVPEGSYATDPADPASRIIQLKQLIMALHQAGIKVIMDVVYNHTYRNHDANLNILYPGYYYRMKEDGRFSDGSGCGNELATEHGMVKKFILDSLRFWIEEYRVDGFRFDLMALMDIDTVQDIVKHLGSIGEDIMIYGEPWTAGNTVLPSDQTTTKGTQKGKGFALFNDNFRNAVKGDNNDYGKGFSQGEIHCMLEVETGIVGSISYDQEHVGFADAARETINYINAHDNLILYDKMKKVLPSVSEEELIDYNKFAMAILFTAQGIPFIHAGNEFLRSKGLHHNTYNLPASVNAIDWQLKERYFSYYSYVKDLIGLRKNHPEFSMNQGEDIKERIQFLYTREQGSRIVYTIKSMDGHCYLLVIHNGNREEFSILPWMIQDHFQKKCLENAEKMRMVQIFDEQGGVKNQRTLSGEIKIPGISTAVYQIFL